MIEETYIDLETGSQSTVEFADDGEVLSEEYFNDDGSSTVYYQDDEGFEVYETTDRYGFVTEERYNPETGENSWSYEDDYGNWVSETYDNETGESTKTVEDDWGNVFIETYDAEGEMIGEVEHQDREGWTFGDCIDEEVAGEW